MADASLNEWLNYAPRAPEIQPGKKWHVFLSYRSVHRPWVLQFYDILRELGYEVFLDQFVLRANDNLILAIQRGLDDSASGMLVWSSRTEDSDWCEKEFATMDQKAHAGDFHYGVAKLDKVELPTFAAAKLYADFSDYSEGPQGSGLLRLLYGIVNQPLSEEAVRFGTKVDDEVRSALHMIEAARSAGNHERLLALTEANSAAWKSTPVLGCAVAESLTKLERYDDALFVIQKVEQLFPRAIRPRQLRGLALARKGDVEEAQLILGELEAAGNRDPETLGMLARTWMDRYNETRQKSFLRKSRNLYLLAFEHTPSDSYVGINAAAKSIMLAEFDKAEELAQRVEKLVGTEVHEGQYWETATAAEVQLMRRNYAKAADLYQAAVDMTPLEYGSHRTTLKQARLLMDHLGTSEVDRESIEKPFSDLPAEGS